ncbi:hypothetical protein T11_11440 [Trichinella zimbabwensis]|uniref:Uncharacterized protein n=1 Tax=Trichinella zimbabwensis TaxID=268475 RepID=A0A0V1G8P3_9BILA|nr:hypothetical protein T11_11440 [Trichinella zimbabwensis]
MIRHLYGDRYLHSAALETVKTHLRMSENFLK